MGGFDGPSGGCVGTDVWRVRQRHDRFIKGRRKRGLVMTVGMDVRLAVFRVL